MSVYYLFISILLLAGFADILIKNKTERVLIAAVVYLTIAIFIGFRFEVGLDWLFYRDLFEGAHVTLAVEPAYLLLSTISHYLIANYWIFQFLITLISIAALRHFFSKLTDKVVFCFIFFIIYQFGFNSEALRQILALTIVLYALTKLLSGCINYFIIMIIIASCFHVSAAIFILFYALWYSKLSFKIARYACYGGLFLAMINIYPIDGVINLLSIVSSNSYVEKIIWYGDKENAGTIFTFNIFFKIAVMIIFEFRKSSIYHKFSKLNKVEAIKLVSISLYLMMFIDIFLGRYGTISTRLDVYMMPPFIVIISWLIDEFKPGLSKFFFYFALMFYLSVSFIRFTDNYYFNTTFIPYRNYIYSIFMGEVNVSNESQVRYYLDNKEKLQ